MDTMSSDPVQTLPSSGTPDLYRGSGPYQVPAHIPPGWPGRPPRAAQPTLDPGPFRWLDLVTVLAYLGLMVVGLAVVVLSLPGVQARVLDEAGEVDQVAAGFVVNLFAYAILVTLALIACWRPFLASFRTFATLTWLKILMIPAAWFLTILVNAVIVLSAGEPITSDNQLAIQEMTLSVPFWLMAPVVVLAGPFVEEYLFRHLMIGKLSRHVNVWICTTISILAFAFMHFVGTGFHFDLVQVLPYLTLSIVISVAYVITGKSLGYAYVLHVFNNLVALSVSYLLLPALG